MLYALATAEGFGEYRSLREQGYSEIDSFAGALGKAEYTVAAEKVGDYIGKNNPIDDYLSAVSGNNSNKKFMDALNSIDSDDIIINKKQIGKKIGEHCEDYGFNPGSENDRIQLLNIINDIVDSAEEIAVGDNWRCQIGKVKYYIKGEDVVVVREYDNEFITILKGGINNERVKEARGK